MKCPHTMKATDYAGAVFCCDCGRIVSPPPAPKNEAAKDRPARAVKRSAPSL